MCTAYYRVLTMVMEKGFIHWIQWNMKIMQFDGFNIFAVCDQIAINSREVQDPDRITHIIVKMLNFITTAIRTSLSADIVLNQFWFYIFMLCFFPKKTIIIKFYSPLFLSLLINKDINYSK